MEAVLLEVRPRIQCAEHQHERPPGAGQGDNVNTSDPALHQEGVGTSDDAAHGGTPPCTGSAPRPSSDTFLELAAEIIDPVEWVALQMTKLPVKPGMTRGEAMDLVKAVVREGFEMLKRQEAQNKGMTGG
jgi:hypothetical protein